MTNGIVFPHAPSAGALPSGRALPMLLKQARAELVKLMRAPDFVAGAVLLPVVLYVLFGAREIGTTLPSGVELGPLMVAAFTAYGLLGIVIFTFGEALAIERGQGWLRLTRTAPVPAAVFLMGKLVAGVAIGLIMVLIMAAVASAFGAEIDLVGWVRLGGVSLLGALALAPLGFLLGFIVRPAAASAVSLLLYIPLAFASGMWIPADELPDVVQAVMPVLPTYHYAELAQSAVSTGSPWEHTLWLAGTFVIGGALAVAAYRRLAQRQFA